MRDSLRPLGLRCALLPGSVGVRGRQAGAQKVGRPSDADPRPCEALEPRRLLAAEPAPVGPEFRINTTTAGSQEFFSEAPRAVASAADGRSIVTWSSAGQDGSSWGVYAQRLAADGSRSGPEFRVNQATSNSQWYPSVAADPEGDFVVAWTSYLQDGSESGVYARRYTAAGAPAGDEFRVNTTAAGNQRHASVALDDDGDFVVTWSGANQAGGAGWDVYARRYAAGGAPRADEFRVNATTAGDQQFADVASDAGGAFVVAWTTDAQDGSGTAVCARRYDASGAARGGEFRVNTFATGNQQYARVAAAPGGDFVVTWASAGQDGSGRGVYAQRYTAAGAKRGGELAVNQTTAGEQFAPNVAADRAGGFVVTWTAAAQDSGGFGVYARAYTAAGAGRGGEFRVNATTAGNQAYASLATDSAGGFLVAWESDGQDGEFFGVFGQRFAPPDLAAPVADVLDVAPDPRTSPVDALTFAFSEPVTGFDPADLLLTRDGVPLNLAPLAPSFATADDQSFTLSGLSPLTGAPGAYLLTLKATGSGIVDGAGNLLAADATESWTVRPAAAATVAGRALFYDNSAFDGFAPGAGAADDAAVATDKVALLPGQPSGAANFSSYTRGINGVMVDVAGLVPADTVGAAAAAPALSAGDFVFRAGNGGDASVWPGAASPALVTIRPGAGVGGADRIALVWAADAVKNQWLQITVLANERTRLAAPDVFFFGNRVGDAGGPVDGTVDRLDLVRTRLAFSAGPVPLTSAFDFNRDGRVGAPDLLAVRRNTGLPPLLPIGAALAAPPPPPVVPDPAAPSDNATSLLTAETVETS